MNHKEIGRIGEQIAQKYLRSLQHKIISTNFATKQGELDIVSLSPEQTLTITEVKTDASGQAGHPSTWVNTRKVQQLHKMGRLYCHQNQISFQQIQFDIITILLHDRHNPKVHHIPNAFIPSTPSYFL